MVKITDEIRAKLKSGCPACGMPVTVHHPEDDNDYEYWEYAYDGAIVRDSHDILSVEDHCRHAMPKALNALAGMTTVVDALMRGEPFPQDADGRDIIPDEDQF